MREVYHIRTRTFGARPAAAGRKERDMIERFGYPYRQKKDVAKILGLGATTVYTRALEIEKEIGKRYNRHAIIHDGNITLINVLVFVDYLTYRKQLKDKNMRKYVPEFDAKAVADQMGWDTRPIAM